MQVLDMMANLFDLWSKIFRMTGTFSNTVSVLLLFTL